MNVKKASSVKASVSHQGPKLAVVLVRGLIDMNQPLKDALRVLRLHRKNHCVIVADNPVSRGMLNKVKDYVTWGEISSETYTELVERRGKEFKARQTDGKKKYSYATIEFKGKKYKPYFALNPPLKGFGRKGIKVAFRAGGALGNRGEKMNDLIKRMM
ncbi:uL30 family ribosomal protein [Candidatus Woesearchaeota archaeon]|nr:uL30 family ribosomal protein [Candidatus Woesearchaeota archaeon]